VERIAYNYGRAVFWSAPSRLGAPPDFARIARVVHTAADMEKACRECPFVVWPSPPLSQGEDARLEAFNEFCRVSMRLREALVVCDELQSLLPSKFLRDAPPHFRDLVELGHKAPGRLAKVFVAHRLAQIPLVLGGGAYRISFKPFPGDDDALAPFFGRDGVERMKRFPRGTFALWSQRTGPRLPVRFNGGSAPVGTGAAPGGAAA
jgi:hypothetical protein